MHGRRWPEARFLTAVRTAVRLALDLPQLRRARRVDTTRVQLPIDRLARLLQPLELAVDVNTQLLRLLSAQAGVDPQACAKQPCKRVLRDKGQCNKEGWASSRSEAHAVVMHGTARTSK